MLFDNVEFQQGAAYWLASRGVNANSDIAGFGPGVVGDGDVFLDKQETKFSISNQEGIWSF